MHFRGQNLKFLIKISIFYQKICNFKCPKSILPSANFCRFCRFFGQKNGKRQTRPPLVSGTKNRTRTRSGTGTGTDLKPVQIPEIPDLPEIETVLNICECGNETV